MESEEIALARGIHELKGRIDELAEVQSKLSAECSARIEALIKWLVDNGKQGTGHIDGIGTFGLRRENYPSVPKTHMATFLEYVRKEGQGALIEEVIPAPTLKKFCKDQIEALAETFADDVDAANEAQTRLNIPLTEVLAPSVLAARVLKEVGVQTFSQIKLSITKKGK